MEGKDLLEFGRFRADLTRRVLLRDNQVVSLPAKAFDVLVVLLRNAGETVSKDDLMKAVWPDTFVEEGNLTQTIFVLRKALGDLDGQSSIVTMPRMGYRFAGTVTGSESAQPDLLATPTTAAMADPKLSSGALMGPARMAILPWTIAGVLALITSGAVWFALHRAKPAAAPFMRLSVDLGPDAIVGGSTTVAISPDGTRIVFPLRGPDGKPTLAIQPLDLPSVTPISEALGATDPFFSPDGQWVGFMAGGKLKKASIHGGPSVTICNCPYFAGASWGEDNQIILALGSPPGLSRINASGGTLQQIAVAPPDQKAVVLVWPQVLPGGDAVLYTASDRMVNFAEANIGVYSLKTRQWKTLQRSAYFGRYLPSGHLVWVHNRALFAARFDPVRLEIKGPAMPIVEDDLDDNPGAGNGKFDFSRSGTLAYLSGRPTQWQLVWMGPDGTQQSLLAKPDYYRDPSLSPDGKRLAIGIGRGDSDIYIYDIQRQALSRLTFMKEANREPLWTDDGLHIAYKSTTPGGGAVWWFRADGAGEPQLLFKSEGGVPRAVLSPDGRTLIVSTEGRVSTIPLNIEDPDHPKPGKPELLLQLKHQGFTGAFSPDGRWLAYSSFEPGETGIYVRPAVAGGVGKWQVSSGMAAFPMWSRSAPQILYQDIDGYIQVVDYMVTGNSFSTAGKPRRWLDKPVVAGYRRLFDLTPDGKHIVGFARPEQEHGSGNLHVTFLVNFFDELRRRLPDGSQ